VITNSTFFTLAYINIFPIYIPAYVLTRHKNSHLPEKLAYGALFAGGSKREKNLAS
jgi:lipoprotein signal peptidase